MRGKAWECVDIWGSCIRGCVCEREALPARSCAKKAPARMHAGTGRGARRGGRVRGGVGGGGRGGSGRGGRGGVQGGGG